jgi:hypothetical protein
MGKILLLPRSRLTLYQLPDGSLLRHAKRGKQQGGY